MSSDAAVWGRHMTSMGFTRVPTLPMIVEVVRQEIGRPALSRCFQAQDVPMDVALKPGAVLPIRDLVGLFEQFARGCGEHAFGIVAGQALNPAAFGILVDYALQAPTLGKAILRMHRTLPLHQSGTSMVLTTENDRSAWSYRVEQPFSLGRHHHAVQVVYQMKQFITGYLGNQPELQEIGLEADAYGLGDKVEEVFGTKVLWSQNANYVAFDSDLLTRSRPANLASGEPVTFRQLIRYARSTPPLNMSDQVAATVRLYLESGQASVEPVARQLGIGVRTLQRRLSAEGSTFQDVLEEVRQHRAEELLLETDLSMVRISALLGYSDPAHFSRAFKRWHGHPPIQLRTDTSDGPMPTFVGTSDNGPRQAA